MKTLLVSLLLLANSFGIDNVSGKWSGTFEATNNQGEKRSEPALLILKQEGTELTGSGGPNDTEQHPMRNGKVDGNKLTFEIATGNSTIHFALTVSGDQIEGDMKRTRQDGREQTARISLKRLADK